MCLLSLVKSLVLLFLRVNHQLFPHKTKLNFHKPGIALLAGQTSCVLNLLFWINHFLFLQLFIIFILRQMVDRLPLLILIQTLFLFEYLLIHRIAVEILYDPIDATTYDVPGEGYARTKIIEH